MTDLPDISEHWTSGGLRQDKIRSIQSVDVFMIWFKECYIYSLPADVLDQFEVEDLVVWGDKLKFVRKWRTGRLTYLQLCEFKHFSMADWVQYLDAKLSVWCTGYENRHMMHDFQMYKAHGTDQALWKISGVWCGFDRRGCDIDNSLIECYDNRFRFDYDHAWEKQLFTLNTRIESRSMFLFWFLESSHGYVASVKMQEYRHRMDKLMKQWCSSTCRQYGNREKEVAEWMKWLFDCDWWPNVNWEVCHTVAEWTLMLDSMLQVIYQ